MTRSDRSTGQFRAYRGSGCIGHLPASKPGGGWGTRRRTKPVRRPEWCHKPKQARRTIRGYRAQLALINRGIRINAPVVSRRSKMAVALAKALSRRQ